MKTKVCNKCGVEKPLTEDNFYRRKDTKSGWRRECIECRKKQGKEKYVKQLEENPNLLAEQYAKNKETDNQKCKEWRMKNKELVKQLKKEYYEKNKETILEKRKKYVEENPEKVKLWFKENKDYRNEYTKEYSKKRYEEDEMYKLKKIISKIIGSSFRRMNWTKKSKSQQIIGCSPLQFKKHIEEQFQDGMTWDNHGLFGWHLDHIIPVSSATNEKEMIKLNHYTNFQPLWAEDNLKKSNKICEEWGNAISL